MRVLLIMCCIAAGSVLHVNSTRMGAGSLKFKWNSTNKVQEKSVEGFVAGTNSGLVAMSFSSLKPINITSKNIFGLSYDWNSRKMYWVEEKVGIMRANLDGSGFQMLLVDGNPFGLAIEPITGNLFVGSRSRPAIRVCNSDANKCSTIAYSSDMTNIEDIAIQLSQGFLFWSIYGSSSKVVRANLDGSNATIILERPTILGLDVDEEEDRLYWTERNNKKIGSCGLNGQDIIILPNIETDVSDVEIDGENVYYSNYGAKSIYSITKQGSNCTLVANLADKARRIALFGSRNSRPVSNPCEYNECDHLCILTSATTYRCVCPDGAKLKEDGQACTF